MALLLAMGSLAAGGEMVDKESVVNLAKGWEYAAIYSLSPDGTTKLYSELKGSEPKAKIPMGRSDYLDFFGKSTSNHEDLLFMFVILDAESKEAQEDTIQSRTTSMRTVVFGRKAEIMQAEPLKFALLVDPEQRSKEKRMFTVPRLIQALAGTDKSIK